MLLSLLSSAILSLEQSRSSSPEKCLQRYANRTMHAKCMYKPIGKGAAHDDNILIPHVQAPNETMRRANRVSLICHECALEEKKK
jgi:hypothetical protein